LHHHLLLEVVDDGDDDGIWSARGNDKCGASGIVISTRRLRKGESVGLFAKSPENRFLCSQLNCASCLFMAAKYKILALHGYTQVYLPGYRPDL
jgi:hypothetical protein